MRYDEIIDTAIAASALLAVGQVSAMPVVLNDDYRPALRQMAEEAAAQVALELAGVMHDVEFGAEEVTMDFGRELPAVQRIVAQAVAWQLLSLAYAAEHAPVAEGLAATASQRIVEVRHLLLGVPGGIRGED